MPPYKNQHYVPQFYMRNFTREESDRIYLFNFENRREFHDSMRNVCSESWFYDDDVVRDSEHDAVIEKLLDEFEGRFASAIKALLERQRIDVLSSETIQSLLRFVSFQAFRTTSPMEHYDELVDLVATDEAREYIHKSDLPEEKRGVLSQADWTTNAPVKMWTVVQALTAKDLLYDLNLALLVNETECGFVFSEEPVILDNRRFKNEYEAPLVGLQNAGLQIFVPISTSTLLFLYDPMCYRVNYNDAERKVISLTSKSTINSLNKTQFVNGHANVFYGDANRESEMDEIYEDVADNIEWERHSTPNTLPPGISRESEKPVRMPPPHSPTLPFVKQRLNADYRMLRHPVLWQQVTDRWRKLLDNWG